MTTYKVGYFVGSLSSTSTNRNLSKALIRVAPDDLEFSEIPIGNLPLYSQDFDNDYPPEARALKASIAAVDAILFVTPEYNRSIPGAFLATLRRQRQHTPHHRKVRVVADRHGGHVATLPTSLNASSSQALSTCAGAEPDCRRTTSPSSITSNVGTAWTS